ncbi:MAG TPA: DegV family protein [Acidimicrobiales bacterium]|nr:DegV family protein [Acidimicrobiales bacterium]
MSGIHIVTDSGSDITPAAAVELGVTVVPLKIRFGDDEFRDGVELSVEEFYAKMAELPGLPSTAAPAPGEFIEAFLAAKDAGATGVVCIDLAGDMSATIDAARNAAAEVADRIEVRVIDSETVSGGLYSLVKRAAEAAAAGKSLDDIEAMVRDRAARTTIFGSFDTLENLKMGGRIGGAQAFLGTVLQIKPIIEIRAGAVHEAGKQRTRRKALAWIIAKLVASGDVEDLLLCEALAPDVELFRGMFPEETNYGELRLGPTIGTHGGRGTMGVSFVLPAAS